MIGQTLAHFRITAKLGEGGMGEVYRAEDTRLGREVAIKMLPEELTADPERLARFEREAQVLASLNHPNIAGIHSIEEADGRSLLVMELVEGEDLAGRLSRGAVEPDEALRIALQMTQGLEAAHERGIVHRDLKPANIKVTPEGEVKILDFGLAKVWQEADEESPDLTRSPTLTAQMTQAGVILGTAAYMSPEQARGQAVDRRADIWSFGVIVYEMLTGRQLFGGGDTVTDALAAILRADIDFDALPEATPPLLRRLLERCLERDSRQRLHDIGDARLDLEEIESGADPFAAAAPDQAPPSRRRSLPWTAAAAALALLIGLAIGRQGAPPEEPDAGSPLHVSLVLPEGTRLAGWASVVALSPDGRKAAYAAEGPDGRHLYVHHLDRGEVSRIEGSHGAEAPFFSPDSQWVGFGAGSISGPSPQPPELRKASLTTGIAQTITPVLDYFGGAWSSDGTIYYVDDIAGGVQRVSSAGGTPEPLAGGGSEDERPGGPVLWPELLPGERSLLAIAYQGSAANSLVHVDIQTGATRDLGIAAKLARYTGTGHLVYVTHEGDLYAVAFDPERGAVRGSPVALLRDLARGAAPVMAVSPGGALLYATGYLQGSGRELSRLVSVDAAGQTTDLGYEPAAFVRRFALSPDESQLAIGTFDGSLWKLDLARGTRSKLPGGTLWQQAQPFWSPDGELLAIHGTGPDNDYNFDIYVQPADGTGEPTSLISEPGEEWPQAFVPGTRRLIYLRWTYDWPWGTLWEVDVDDPASARELLRQDEVDLIQASVSPDGRWLAYVTGAAGELEVWLRTYPGLDSARQVSVRGGSSPQWAPGSNTLYYWGERTRDLLMAVEVREDGTLSPPRPLFRLPFIGSSARGVSYAPRGDGSFLAILREPDSGVVTRLQLVLDWTAQLAEVAPAD